MTDDSRTPPFAGALLASFAAGPLFFLTGTVIELSGPGSPDLAPAALFLLAVLPVTIPVGFLLPAIPNLFGTWAMHTLGRRNVAARLALLWALAGGVFATGLYALFGQDVAASDNGGAALIITGVGCALICRRFATWDD